MTVKVSGWNRGEQKRILREKKGKEKQDNEEKGKEMNDKKGKQDNEEKRVKGSLRVGRCWKVYWEGRYWSVEASEGRNYRPGWKKEEGR